MRIPEWNDWKDEVWYHGSPSGELSKRAGGLHVGTLLAATQALESRIGVPADGRPWDGSRVYGETPLAGRRTLKRLQAERGYFLETGLNCRAPEDDYLPGRRGTERAKYGDGKPVNMASRPKIYKVHIVGPMTNSPHSPMSDTRANATIRAMMTKGTSRRGYYYKNDGEGEEGNISAVVPDGDHLRIIP